MLPDLKGQVEKGKLLPYSIAVIYASLGDNQNALHWLERAYRDRDVNITYLKVDSFFDNMRTDSRFQDLMRRVGLTPG